MLASGKLPPDALPGDLAGQDCILGLEFTGRDTKGRRVMGMVAARGLATTVLADPTFLWEVPEKWDLAEASTIPVVYSTVSIESTFFIDCAENSAIQHISPFNTVPNMQIPSHSLAPLPESKDFISIPAFVTVQYKFLRKYKNLV